MLKNHDENTKTSFENSVVNFKYDFNKKNEKDVKAPSFKPLIFVI
jgi:hypothetical protein